MYRSLLIFLTLLATVTTGQAASTVDNYLQQIKADPLALYRFFKAMPKGGELHYHLAGSTYAENMLNLIALGEYCLDKSAFSLKKKQGDCAGADAAAELANPAIYAKTVTAWSMKDFVPGAESAHDHFFASFFKFRSLIADKAPMLLAEIIERAADQRESYLEIMYLPEANYIDLLAAQIAGLNGWDAKYALLKTSPQYQKAVSAGVAAIQKLLVDARRALHCDKDPKQARCQPLVRFQIYVLREMPLDAVFVQAAVAFEMAKLSPEIVGVNLVQAEDGPISLRDYHQQMLIFQDMHRRYPQVHISLHAGELAPGLVSPEHLAFHIHDAIRFGQAERVGHGVDIAYEDKPEELLALMAKRPVPVEINLRSNQVILGVHGPWHPLKSYLTAKVPVILSTDDEGILRTDLTGQYVQAVLEQGLDYAAIRQINRNTLEYSFLPGASLWRDASYQVRNQACEVLDSPSCLAFVAKHQKAALQWRFEKALLAFEADYIDKPR